MWTWIISAVEWMAGTKVGRTCAAIVAAIAGVLFLRAKWRGEGAAEQRAEQARETIETQERINEAGANYRADGAAGRLRDGSF